MAFPRQVAESDKPVVFELYVPGLTSPFRTVEFRVKDMVVKGKLGDAGLSRVGPHAYAMAVQRTAHEASRQAEPPAPPTRRRLKPDAAFELAPPSPGKWFAILKASQI